MVCGYEQGWALEDKCGIYASHVLWLGPLLQVEHISYSVHGEISFCKCEVPPSIAIVCCLH